MNREQAHQSHVSTSTGRLPAVWSDLCGLRERASWESVGVDHLNSHFHDCGIGGGVGGEAEDTNCVLFGGVGGMHNLIIT